MEDLLFELVNSQDTEFYKLNKKRYGLVVNWFSDVFGRIILKGKMTYEADKNYRCGDAFEKYLNDNMIERDCLVILIHTNSDENSWKHFKDFQRFFCNETFDIPQVLIIGTISNKYKKLQNKQFYVNTDNAIVFDIENGVKKFVESRITLDCIFPNLPTQEDSMLA
jgi:hypothetical protein